MVPMRAMTDVRPARVDCFHGYGGVSVLFGSLPESPGPHRLRLSFPEPLVSPAPQPSAPFRFQNLQGKSEKFRERKSGRGLPRSKTLRDCRGRWEVRQVLECASPLALWNAARAHGCLISVFSSASAAAISAQDGARQACHGAPVRITSPSALHRAAATDEPAPPKVSRREVVLTGFLSALRRRRLLGRSRRARAARCHRGRSLP